MKVQRYVHDPKDPQSISANALTTVTVDKDGYVWILDYNGVIQRYDPASNEFEKVFDKGSSDRTIYLDRQENLLCTSINGFHPFDTGYPKQIFLAYHSGQKTLSVRDIRGKKTQ